MDALDGISLVGGGSLQSRLLATDLFCFLANEYKMHILIGRTNHGTTAIHLPSLSNLKASVGLNGRANNALTKLYLTEAKLKL